MQHEEKLKEARLKETDERELEVANHALRFTAKIMLAVLYVFLIVGALFWEEIMLVCCILVGIFFFQNRAVFCSRHFIKKYRFGLIPEPIFFYYSTDVDSSTSLCSLKRKEIHQIPARATRV